VPHFVNFFQALSCFNLGSGFFPILPLTSALLGLMCDPNGYGLKTIFGFYIWSSSSLQNWIVRSLSQETSAFFDKSLITPQIMASRYKII